MPASGRDGEGARQSAGNSAGAGRRQTENRFAVTRLLDAAHDHLLAFGNATEDFDISETALSDRDVAPFGEGAALTIAHHEDRRLAILDEDRFLGHGQRLPVIEHDGQMHEHAGRQFVVRVGGDGAGAKGPRDRVDPAVDTLDTALENAVRERRCVGENPLAQLDPAKQVFRDREFDFDQREVVQGGDLLSGLDP